MFPLRFKVTRKRATKYATIPNQSRPSPSSRSGTQLQLYSSIARPLVSRMQNRGRRSAPRREYLLQCLIGEWAREEVKKKKRRERERQRANTFVPIEFLLVIVIITFYLRLYIPPSNDSLLRRRYSPVSRHGAREEREAIKDVATTIKERK